MAVETKEYLGTSISHMERDYRINNNERLGARYNTHGYIYIKLGLIII